MTDQIGWVEKSQIKWDGNIPLIPSDMDALIEAGGRSGVVELDRVQAMLEQPPSKHAERHCFKLPFGQLAEVGRASRRQWRALFCLSVMWHKRESAAFMARQLTRGRYLFATTKDGDPNPRAVAWLPKLTSRDLAKMCYPTGKLLRSEQFKEARRNINKLAERGHIVIVEHPGNGWIIARPFAEPWAKPIPQNANVIPQNGNPIPENANAIPHAPATAPIDKGNPPSA